MTDPNFEPFKLEIERLYIHENKILSEVMEYMESKYSFVKSSGQYSRQLKKWGISKQNIKAKEWEWIGNKENKRKLHENKESEFYMGGNQVHVPQVKKAKYRDAYCSSIARFSTAPSPNTPEGFFVCTPASPGMHLLWNGSLPWLRFIKLLHSSQNEEAPSPSSSLTIKTPHGADALSRSVNHQLMSRLSTLIPWNKLTHPPNLHSSSRTSTALSILMPEEYEGQHDALSTDLNSSKNKGREHLALELFLLSNNITSQDPRGRTSENIRSDDERVMQMLEDSGWKDLKHIQILLSTREPTAEAIAERVFTSALRLHDIETVAMMLKFKMDPNSASIESISRGILTPLQFVAASQDERSEELINLLVSHGADVNYTCNEYPPLFYAIDEHGSRNMRAFMSHGAIVMPSCLSAATCLKDIEAFSDIANSCSDVNARSGWQDPSALAQAVTHGNVPIIKVLLAKGANIHDLVVVNFEDDIATTTILGLSVQSASNNVVRALLSGCHEMNPDFDGLPYVSPVVLAVERKNVEITHALLQAGVDIKQADGQGKMTLLERATENRYSVALCKVLIEHGAQVNRPVSSQKYESSALLKALKRKSSEVAQLLIEAGARLNDEHTQPPYTALGAAIEHGDGILIQTLLATGATVVGTKLEAIGSLGTAMFLQANDVLRGVLNVSGPGILATALLAKNTDLARYLLEHDADREYRMGNEDHVLSNQTPLEAAIEVGNVTFAETLLKRGAKVTDSVLAGAISKDPVLLKHLLARFGGCAPTAVGIAVFCGEPLQLLQEAGVDPTGVPQIPEYYWDLGDFQLPPPESVLEVAVVARNREALQFLLQWTPWNAKLIGRALTFAILLQLNEMVEDLLPFDSDMTQEITIQCPYYEDDFGEVAGERETYTPLQAAVNRQMIHVARALMEKADVNYLGHGVRCRTALQHAVEKGNMELINLLLSKHGARIDEPPATDGGATALQISCLKGYMGITRRLLDLGADVNEAPAKHNGRTALQGAAEYGRIDILHMLLNEGALVIGEGEMQYRKAVELAEQNGHNAAARMLRSWRDSVFLSPSTS
ncbi:hypothetical protein PENANT_c007G00022 [Penicillium antarcticum]|uniref:Clr5 domain-containing protein n=1 Tax=Penicillium antarcticum TaxID=416450 RepID=A0A1V6QC36_9EURO|nr:hypothetical protein PENANT_c007G00022 [Penicillium antarcticum]